MTPLPNTNNSNSNNTDSTTGITTSTKFDYLTMPVNHAALEAAVYGSTGGTVGSGIQNSTTTNPYCTPIGYNNSTAAAAAAYANPYSYHMAIRNAAPFTNYFNSLGSTVANVGNSAAYYSGYGTTTNPTGFDYNSYASSNQYYTTGTSSNINSNSNSRAAVAAANNYYNATAAAAAFPYGTLAGTETLPTSSSTLISASQISPYSTVTTNQKSEHKPPRKIF
uniref:Uncharacterized protein n=1 Tax=Panagrolaimus sp. PS1159 TaxID=55785 RepID=A0AC35F5L9_9BILA